MQRYHVTFDFVQTFEIDLEMDTNELNDVVKHVEYEEANMIPDSELVDQVVNSVTVWRV